MKIKESQQTIARQNNDLNFIITEKLHKRQIDKRSRCNKPNDQEKTFIYKETMKAKKTFSHHRRINKLIISRPVENLFEKYKKGISFLNKKDIHNGNLIRKESLQSNFANIEERSRNINIILYNSKLSSSNFKK